MRNLLLPFRLVLLLLAAGLAGPAAGQAFPPTSLAPRLAFPSAVGWAADTPGGRGGAILRVTTLAAEGPGSLQRRARDQGAAQSSSSRSAA